MLLSQSGGIAVGERGSHEAVNTTEAGGPQDSRVLNHQPAANMSVWRGALGVSARDQLGWTSALGGTL